MPARNEADVVGAAIGSLAKQRYAGAFHIVLEGTTALEIVAYQGQTMRAADLLKAKGDRYVLGKKTRGVLAPEFLPKSPLASPMFVDSIGEPVGASVQPSAFQPGGRPLAASRRT